MSKNQSNHSIESNGLHCELTQVVIAAGLCLMGTAATVGHFLLILAYRRAPASTLTPYLYAQIGFAMLGGWWVFNQVPDTASLFGIALIAVCGAAGAWLTMRERRIPIEPVEP